MICSHCGRENDADAGFCEHCGKPIEITCPRCGTKTNPGAAFCKICGARLTDGVPAQAEPHPPGDHAQAILPAGQGKDTPLSSDIEGERKPVTILFTDIVGSTSIAEKLDPEEWKEIVNGVHHLVTQVVYRYEGTIAQLLGDGALAFFGAPVTHEDDPLRAVHAALDIQSSLSSYRRQMVGLVDDFQMRVGIHVGTVVVGQVGDDRHTEYLAVGDAVNLASRLQSAARPGGVLVSEAIARQVRAAFEMQSMGEISVKGKAEPVRVFEVIQEKLAPENPRGFEELHSSLVGRANELRLINEALETVASGHGQIISILGEAGIGKSRLVEEVHRSRPNLEWIEGRGLSYGQSLPFWTITQLLFCDLGLSDGDPEIRIRTAMKKRVSELFSGQSAEILPYLLRLVGVSLEGDQAEQIKGLEGETLKHQTLVAIRRYFQRLAQARPTVLVFEDLHWADPSSLESLDRLLALTDRVPLMLILIARPERELPFWQMKIKAETDFPHRYTEIQLKPLSGDEQNQLVDNLLALADLPDSIRSMILSHAEGNPFYLEEIIRSLIDQGSIVVEEGHWRSAGDIQDIHIPPTLEGVLLARIDRLQEDSRHTLQLAAVIGKSFLYRLLAVIAEAEQDLDRQLAQLQRVDLIREKTRQPELEYIFKHSLTQEAAYNSLLIERRREFHRRVGHALEDLFADRKEQYLGLLAYHFEAAGERARAIDYLIRAGDQARLTDEHTEAIDYYQRAIKLLEGVNDEERASQVWLKLGLIYHANFEFKASHQAYEEAFSLRQELRGNQAEGKKNEGYVFREAVVIPFSTFDPGKIKWQPDAHVAFLLFSGLARISSEMDVLPEIARSWQVLDGGRRYLFTLRDDFKWSDGTPVTAEDFEWAWKRNLSPTIKTDNATNLYDIVGAREYHLGINPDPGNVGVRALDARTLQVLLVQPLAYFPFIITLPIAFPLPKKAIERFGGEWWHPGKIVTNGPFRLVELDPQKRCLVDRNPDYPDPLPGNISHIEWLVLPEEETIQAYIENRIDFAGTLATLIPDKVPQQEIYYTPQLMVLYLYFNPEVSPLDDPRVRKALIMAINEEKYFHRQNTTVPKGGLIPPGMPGHSPDIGHSRSVEIGRRYLAEAGFPGGKGFPTLSAVTLHSLVDKIAAELTHQWQDNLGIEVVFHGSDPWEIKDWKVKDIGGAMAINGWMADYPDPDTFLRQSEAIAMLKYFGWRDAEYDRLVEQAASTSDRKKRMEMYRQADYLLVHEQALVVPLNHGQSLIRQMVKPWVKNFIPNPLGVITYQDITIDK